MGSVATVVLSWTQKGQPSAGLGRRPPTKEPHGHNGHLTLTTQSVGETSGGKEEEMVCARSVLGTKLFGSNNYISLSLTLALYFFSLGRKYHSGYALRLTGQVETG